MVYGYYEALLKAGMSMRDIDAMDFPGYLSVIAWTHGENEEVFIDDLPFFGMGAR